MDTDKIGMKTFGERVKKLRKEKGLTQKQLSEKLNKSEKYISNIETGLSQSCSLAMFIELVKTLDTSADFLLGGFIEYTKDFNYVEPLVNEIAQESIKLTGSQRQLALDFIKLLESSAYK